MTANSMPDARTPALTFAPDTARRIRLATDAEEQAFARRAALQVTRDHAREQLTHLDRIGSLDTRDAIRRDCEAAISFCERALAQSDPSPVET